MKKKTDPNLKILADGIPGIYRSSQYKLKVARRITAIVLVLVLCGTGLFLALRRPPQQEAEPVWNGSVIVLQKTSAPSYKLFFGEKFFPTFLLKLDMSKEVFAEKSNLQLCESDQIPALLCEIYGDSVTVDDLEFKLFMHVILLDENGNVVVSGIDEGAFLQGLRDTGFMKTFQLEGGN